MESEFKNRLESIIGTESARSFALRAGMADTTLRQYLNGRSEPNMSQLIKIADTAGVRIDWLATGRGPKEFPCRQRPAPCAPTAQSLRA